MTKKIQVIQDPENPVATEVLAQAIVDISKGVKAMNSSRLSRRAILVLLKDSTGQSLATVESVLKGLETLERTYLK